VDWTNDDSRFSLTPFWLLGRGSWGKVHFPPAGRGRGIVKSDIKFAGPPWTPAGREQNYNANRRTAVAFECGTMNDVSAPTDRGDEGALQWDD